MYSRCLRTKTKKSEVNKHVFISVSATGTDWHQGNVLPHQWHATVSTGERPHIYTEGVSERTIHTAGGGERGMCLCVHLGFSAQSINRHWPMQTITKLQYDTFQTFHNWLIGKPLLSNTDQPMVGEYHWNLRL